jgi:putative addiction module antidote
MSSSTKLRKIGNSHGVVLPKELLERHGFAEGDTIYVIETADGIKLTPYDSNLGDAMKIFEEGRKRYRNALHELAK